MANIIVEDIKQKIKSGNPVTRLILINVVVFLFFSLLQIFLFLTNDSAFILSVADFFIKIFSFPISLDGIIYSPWTIISYSFTHFELMHLLFNMLTLYWFGEILLRYTSENKIIPLYLLGAIAGALFSVIVFELLPGFLLYRGAPMVGASAGVTAIIVAVATLIPNFRINLFLIGEVKLIYVAIFTVFISILNVTFYANVGGNLAHLGGAIIGFIFIHQYKKGKDLSKGINVFFTWIKKLFNKSSSKTMKTVYKRSVSDEEYNYNKKMQEQKVDEILDKISKSGYGSLSKSERDFLSSINKR